MVYEPGISSRQIQEYRTANPAPVYGQYQQNFNTDYAGLIQSQGWSYLDRDTQGQYASDLFNMETAGRQNVGSLIFPQGVGGADFAQLESYADQFAAQAGWRYYPTSQQFSQMMASGLNIHDKTATFKWLANVNGVSNKFPGLAGGLTNEEYQVYKTHAQATIAQYTGNPDMYSGLLQEAMSHGSAASAWLQTQLTTNAKYTKNAQTPWLQYGMTYEQFHQEASANKREIMNRYGAEATLTQQADYLGNPVKPLPQAGTAIGTPATKGGELLASAGMSSVR